MKRSTSKIPQPQAKKSFDQISFKLGSNHADLKNTIRKETLLELRRINSILLNLIFDETFFSHRIYIRYSFKQLGRELSRDWRWLMRQAKELKLSEHLDYEKIPDSSEYLFSLGQAMGQWMPRTIIFRANWTKESLVKKLSTFQKSQRLDVSRHDTFKTENDHNVSRHDTDCVAPRHRSNSQGSIINEDSSVENASVSFLSSKGEMSPSDGNSDWNKESDLARDFYLKPWRKK